MKELTSVADLDQCLAAPGARPVLLFKHSTACPVSAEAYRRLLAFEGAAGDAAPDIYLVNVIEDRPVSNAIEARLSVAHQSPQAILVKSGAAVWSASHYGITPERIGAAMAGAAGGSGRESQRPWAGGCPARTRRGRGIMRLYLIQHGDAVGKEVDPERPLSGQGEQDVAQMAAFLERAGVRVNAIWHSGKTRARQTAEGLAGALAPEGVAEPSSVVEPSSGLDPNDPVGGLSKDLRGRSDDLAIVGHLPHLSRLASRLLTGDEGAEVVAFQKGGVVCLERDIGQAWHVVWMVVPGLLQRDC
ncbi:MAG: phosphohistidine phosphatase SixA [Candidatus Hydrogenedentes bacterium]|nr:phosphohistidine phosphatase SixA [Candidatus Hydrogenedentota bacterium]